MEIKNKEITLNIDGKEINCFAVVPKQNCPHILQSEIEQLEILWSEKKELITSNACECCQDNTENWICLNCMKVFCSRVVKGHMVDHNVETKHSIVLSFFDGSFWCYDCDSYIINKSLEQMQRLFSKIKYPETEKIEENKNDNEKKDEEQKQHEPKIEVLLQNLKLNDEKFSYDTFIAGIKNKKYKRIIFLTGAGISVSAGIPDFRSPGTGLYSKLQSYNLPYPEAVFELKYFKKNPQAFYTLSKGFLTAKIKPTTSHFLQKMIYDLGVLLQIFTQNIDSLELETGLPSDKLCQAHGHLRTCHCINCKTEQDPKKMMENIENETIYKCDKEGCNGLVKPDIIFFGENLPADFFQKSYFLEKTDLAIVMGTSLVVFPFANLISLIPNNVPIVLINREDSYSKGKTMDNYLFIGGDLDQNVEKIVKDLDMIDSYEKIKKEALEKK